MYILIGLLVVLFLFFLYRVKLTPAGCWHEDFLSLPVSKGLQGFCAVLIVMHHISQQLAENAGPLHWLENVGVCFVGIFFFFSGYGLLKSLLNKEDYLKGFFRKRMPVILIPFYVIIFIFLAFSLSIGDVYTPGELIGIITGWLLLNTHMWYIVEIAIFYIAFYFIFRFIKKRSTALAVMTVFVVLVTVGSLLLGHGDYWFQGEWWFNTSLLFVIGMFIAQYETQIVAFIKRFYAAALVLFAAATALFFSATMYMLENYSYWSETETSLAYGDKFRCLSVQLPFVICFVFLLLIITMKVQFKNPILSFLGNISLELYLIHNLFLILFSWIPGFVIEDRVLFTFAVLCCSITAATILHFLDGKLIGLFKKKQI